MGLDRVLVLGGAGFIGYHLAQRLVEDTRLRITLVDNLSRGELDEELEILLKSKSQLQLLKGDLSNTDIFSRLEGPFDQVYLLAGIVGVSNVVADPARVIHTNTAIILNTLEWLGRTGCGRLLFASSSETYADAVRLGLAGVPTDETTPVAVLNIQHPRSSYAVTKILGESAVAQYARRFGFDAVITRFHNVYGPRMGFSHVIPELIDRVLRRADPLPVYGLEQTRAFCYVTDAVDASCALMNCNFDGCELVHVGNDREEVSISELVTKILKIAGLEPKIMGLPAPSGSIARRCPDITKLMNLTGFKPKVGLDAGLKLTFDWYRRMVDPRADATVP